MSAKDHKMVKTTDSIIIYRNDEYPFGYTITNNRTEASELCIELVKRVESSGVSMVEGSKHWKTGKPAYWIVYFDAPYIIKSGWNSITQVR